MSNENISGHVDILESTEVSGWVVDTSAPEKHVNVQLLIDGALLTSVAAELPREDLGAAGYSSIDHGFSFKPEPDLQALVAGLGKTGSVKITVWLPEYDCFLSEGDLDACNERVNLDSFTKKHSAFDTLKSKLELFQFRLGSADPELDLSSLEKYEPSGCYSKLFDPDPKYPAVAFNTEFSPRPDLFKYLTFNLERFKVTKDLDYLATNASHQDRAAEWYLQGYLPGRDGLRAPLPAAFVRYLNEPLPLGNHSPISRGQFLLDIVPNRRDFGTTLSDPNTYHEAVRRWCVDIAPHMKAEDCLIPPYYSSRLRSMSPNRVARKFPISRFLDDHLGKGDYFKLFNLARATDRFLAYVLVVLDAADRPDFISLLPGSPVRDMIQAEQPGDSLLLKTFATLLGEDRVSASPIFKSEANLRSAMFDRSGYDLQHQKFRFLDSEGNRTQAAYEYLKSPEPVPEYDVQVIGPFEKASGLGQATRMCGSCVDQDEFVTNFVDFDLDNPAPEGFNDSFEFGPVGKAKINLMHLNAESIPSAFAYLANHFKESYNIGYFFWELDSPAPCHYLALELLDEVGVATEFGVSVYQPATELPVTNIGMAVETLPEVDSVRGRRVLESFVEGDPVNPDTKIFLSTFDSFSFVMRKNPLAVIEAFQQAFTKGEDVRLVMKTQNRDSVYDPPQVALWEAVDALVSADPRITVLNLTLPFTELLQMKSGATAYISLHRSEGWGFGMIEAMSLGVPVVATGYSGNLEFCNAENCYLVDYDEVLLAQPDYIFVVEGQKWAEPRVAHAASQLQEIYQNPDEALSRGAIAKEEIANNFSEQAISKRFSARLKDVLALRSSTS